MHLFNLHHYFVKHGCNRFTASACFDVAILFYLEFVFYTFDIFKKGYPVVQGALHLQETQFKNTHILFDSSTISQSKVFLAKVSISESSFCSAFMSVASFFSDPFSVVQSLLNTSSLMVM